MELDSNVYVVLTNEPHTTGVWSKKLSHPKIIKKLPTEGWTKIKMSENCTLNFNVPCQVILFLHTFSYISHLLY